MKKTVLKVIVHSVIAIFLLVIGPPFNLPLLAVVLYYLAMCINAWYTGVNIANLFRIN